MEGRLRALAPAAAILGAVALLAATVVARNTLPYEGQAVATALVAALTVSALLYVAWHTEPAWLLTGAILLSAFSGHWEAFGLPGGVAPDRLALFGGIAGILFRCPAMQDRPLLRIGPVHFLLAATLVWAVASAIASDTLSDGETTT